EAASRLRGLGKSRGAEGQRAQRGAAQLQSVAAAQAEDLGGLRVVRHVIPPVRCRYCELGSRTSRRPSPRRLKASTVTMMAMPGNTEIQGAVSRYVRPSFSMLPHDGVGGWAERPRYDSEASIKIACENATVPCTTNGEITFGSTCLSAMTRRGAPSARTAST